MLPNTANSPACTPNRTELNFSHWTQYNHNAKRMSLLSLKLRSGPALRLRTWPAYTLGASIRLRILCTD